MNPVSPEHPGKDLSLLRLLQLVSPALPVGSYAYSQGLEWSVEAGWVHDSDSTADWLRGQLSTTMAYTDLPLLARLYDAWACADMERVDHWNQVLSACRETAELRQEEHHRGQALLRVLVGLEVEAAQLLNHLRVGFITTFALAACHWSVPRDAAIAGYAWSWLESQVLAAIKLVPLGQLAGQRLLVELAEQIPGVCIAGLACSDEAIGSATPGVAIASCLHETQYARLFRS